jgi:hypothetical protein
LQRGFANSSIDLRIAAFVGLYEVIERRKQDPHPFLADPDPKRSSRQNARPSLTEINVGAAGRSKLKVHSSTIFEGNIQ